MQNGKKGKPVAKKQQRKVRFEDLLEDDRFDDEDYDSVTDDTLEFLSLDDDMIESYQKEQSAKKARGAKGKKRALAARPRPVRYVEEDYEEEDYEDEDYEDEEIYEDEEDDEDEVAYEDEDEDEDYEDDDYEDEDYEDDDYEDEDYEDEDYEDDDYDDDDYEDEDGFAARLTYFFREMNGLDMAVAVLGILVLVGACVTGGIYVHARSTAKQVASFAAVGEQIEGVSVIGESGLLAASEYARLGHMIDVEEEDPEEQEEQEGDEEEDENGEVTVELRLTSILSDMKIKFVNKKTDKLIGGVPFEVEVSGPKSYTLKDDDKDGVIYQKDIAAGNYEVKILPLSGEAAEKYKLPSSASSVKVTDKIAYEKVDVADEVKKESEINVAQEEATVQNTVVESTLKDTVEWVESTKTPIEVGGGDADFEAVSLENIVDPWKVSSAFRKMTGENPDDTTGDDNGDGDDDKGNTGDGSGDNGNTGDGSGDNGNTGDGSGDNGNTGDGSGDNGNTGDGSGDNGNTGDGSGDNGNTGDGSGDNGNTGDGSGGGNTGDNETPKPPKPSEKDVNVSLSSTGLNLEVGGSQTINVSGSDGKSYAADWSSNNTSVATVSGGTITAKAAGTATITAKVKAVDGIKFNTSTLTCSVNVKAKDTPKKEVTVKLNKTSLVLEAGKSETLNVSGDDGSSYSADWSSNNTSVATVSGGTITAKAAGKATITVNVKGTNGVTIKNPGLSCSVEVTAKSNQVEVKLNKTELNLAKDKKETLQILDANGKTYSGTWTTSDKSVAEVHSDGQVKAKKDGIATVSVKVKAPEGVVIKNPDLSCKVIVGNVSYTKITVSGSKEVGIKQNMTLTAKTKPEGAVISWSSLNEKIAKVDQKGVVTGVAEGKVKIRAACKESPEIWTDYEITVKKSVVDPKTLLKDKNGNQLYYKKSGEFKEATYQDFLEHTHFFKRKASAYKYTGWQTIDGHLYYYDKDGKYVTGDQVIQGARYSFGSDGKMAKSDGTMGIDVSKHNGNIDWNAVKNSGVSYVIIRCGYRGYSTGVLVEDPKFKSNIKGAKAAGLKVGAYFFSQAVNEVEAVEEASMAIDLVKGYGLNYPLFLDVEGSGGRADGISRETRTAVCKTFCQTVQNSGISAGVYANKTWFTEKINASSLTGYKLWLAQYASAPTYTATRYDLWQYSSKGKVSGISGNVDMNISYVNY